MRWFNSPLIWLKRFWGNLFFRQECHDSEMERDGKGVPVLLKQYLKAGGRLLAVNVDRNFSNAIDALIAVDLRQAPPAVLDRSVGKDQDATFRAWHAMRA